MKPIRALIAAVAVGLFSVVVALSAAARTPGAFSTTVLSTTGVEVGVVDWTIGMVTVQGMGTASTGSEMQKKMMARLAAKTDGLRRLAECIGGTRVDGETLMRDLEVVNDDVRTSVSGCVKNAVVVPGSEVVEEGKDGSIGVIISMQAPLTDLTSIILKAKQITETTLTSTSGATGVQTSTTVSVAAGSYTGLVVNVATFLSYSPAIDFCIYSASGELLYGLVRVNPSYVSQSNLASYINSVIDAKQRLQDRVGTNPFQVVAVQLRPNKCDIVVSDGDAITIRQMTTVIKQCKVAIVTGR